jgi:hypothetical protein
MPGAARHNSDVESLSAIAIKLSVTAACFEITSGLVRPVPVFGAPPAPNLPESQSHFAFVDAVTSTTPTLPPRRG